MKFWFVNLGKFYKFQREGGYLWAPLYDKNRKTKSYWDSLSEVNENDIIFCNDSGKIVSIGIAKDCAYLADIPKEFGKTWCLKGRKIDVNYKDLKNPIKYKDYKDYILKNINSLENPFDINGNAKVGYLFPLDEKIARYLLDKTNNEKAKEEVEKNHRIQEDEVDDIKEEKEHNEKINNGSVKPYDKKELKKKEQDSNINYSKKNSSSRRVKTDPRLKATRIDRANYLCEVDHNHKTFTNASGEHQYVECHHIIPVNAQKDFPNVKLDSMFNLISICPICHTKVHYAYTKIREEIFMQMYKIREQEMTQYGFTEEKIKEIFNKYY